MTVHSRFPRYHPTRPSPTVRSPAQEKIRCLPVLTRRRGQVYLPDKAGVRLATRGCSSFRNPYRPLTLRRLSATTILNYSSRHSLFRNIALLYPALESCQELHKNLIDFIFPGALSSCRLREKDVIIGMNLIGQAVQRIAIVIKTGRGCFGPLLFARQQAVDDWIF